MINNLYDEEEDRYDEEGTYELGPVVDDIPDEEETEEPDMFEISKDDYKVNSISNNFLNAETSIKIESSKTVIKFSYQGEIYKGIVMQKLRGDDYIFLVQKAGKNSKKDSNNQKVLKKIHIPDASIV